MHRRGHSTSDADSALAALRIGAPAPFPRAVHARGRGASPILPDRLLSPTPAAPYQAISSRLSCRSRIDGVVPEGDDTPAARELHDAVGEPKSRGKRDLRTFAFLREDGSRSPSSSSRSARRRRSVSAPTSPQHRANRRRGARPVVAASTRGVSRSLAKILDFVYKGIMGLEPGVAIHSRYDPAREAERFCRRSRRPS
jgi:hypothetical protein